MKLSRLKHIIPIVAVALSAATACTEIPAPTAQQATEPEPPAAGHMLCDQSSTCPDGMHCNGGICAEGVAPTGPGVIPPSEVAGIEICDDDGCTQPMSLGFGGSRIGSVTQRTLRIKSVGEVPLEILHLDVVGSSTEFSADPAGDLGMTVQPGEELIVRISHEARDGVADRDQLQIVTNADTSRVVIDLETEYKGVPTLYVGDDPARNTGDIRVVDFGTVRQGDSRTHRFYIKNKDRVIDGSVLSVDDIRIEPIGSPMFALVTDTTLPTYLNQFDALCASDANCDQTAGDTCDVALGVCAATAGTLRDVVAVDVTFNADTTGDIEASVVVVSNDGGGRATTTILLTAEVTYNALSITPDPIAFTEVFIGHPEEQTVTLSNDGTAPLNINAIDLATGGDFTLDLGAVSLPLALMPRQTATVDVVFDPAAAGTQTAQLEVTTDAAMAMQTVTVTGEALEAPVMELSESSVDFGDVHVLGDVPVEITVTNTGGSELRVSSLLPTQATSAAYTVEPAALPPIAPGDSETFTVRYNPVAPSHPAVESGAIEIVSNDPASQPSLQMNVSGRGVNPNVLVLPGLQVNFNDLASNPNRPDIYEGQSLSTSVEILNSGIGPLFITGAQVSGDTRGAYSIVGLPRRGATVDAGDRITVSLGYQAPSAGIDGATVQLQTNDLDIPGGVISITVIASTSGCPAVANASGGASAGGDCNYTCNGGYYDLNGDLGALGGNGCEYACSYSSSNDLPDDNFTDANCDGIDGNWSAAVFVSENGSDSNPGSSALPMATVSAAVSLASTAGKDVYVAGGGYIEPSRLILEDGVSIYGAFDPADWSRGAGNLTEIQVADRIGVYAVSINSTTRLSHLTIHGGDASGTGSSAYGVYARYSDGLILTRSVIVAGSGGAGRDGTSRTGTGADGTDGARGQAGCENSGTFCGNCSRPTGGSGGSSSCSRYGGRGGSPGAGGSNGSTGSSGAGGTSGGSGTPAGRGNWSTPSTYWGRNGADGSNGNNGSAGSARYYSTGYSPSSGRTGYDGANGNGGGGGGGGGGGSTSCDSYGGAGGGGGGGGCGGDGGSGGSSGGGSFAVYLWGSDATISVCDLYTSAPGRGGRRGDGQTGGDGGEGGSGTLYGAGNAYGGSGEQDDGSNGGRGGWGGDGGRGGHGGGGAGGPSIGVVRGGSSSASVSGNTYTLGSAGSGGYSRGTDGSSGRRQNSYTP